MQGVREFGKAAQGFPIGALLSSHGRLRVEPPVVDPAAQLVGADRPILAAIAADDFVTGHDNVRQRSLSQSSQARKGRGGSGPHPYRPKRLARIENRLGP